MQRFRTLLMAWCLLGISVAIAPPTFAQNPPRSGNVPTSKVATSEILQAAQIWIDRGDGRKAVRLIENALPSASPADRSACLDALRLAYPIAARQADKAGNAQEAEEYRTNLEILKRKNPAPPAEPPPPSTTPRPAAAPLTRQPPESTTPASALPTPPEPLARPEAVAPIPSPEPGPPEPRPTPINEPPPTPLEPDTPTIETPPATAPLAEAMPRDDQIRVSSDESLDPPAPAPVQSDAPPPTPETPAVATEPAAVSPPPPSDDNSRIEEADEAFRSARYAEAGDIYADLHQAGRLPRLRFDAYAYCRRHTLVQRINDKPRDRAEWSAILDEITAIRKLTPNHWYDEYLLSLVTELMTKAGIEPNQAAAPAPAQAPAPNRRSPISRYAQPANEDQPARSASDLPADATPFDAYTAPTAVVEARSGNWQVLKTANFLIYHDDPELARQVAARAEQARTDAWSFWAGPNRPLPVWSPPCYLYLFPDATLYVAVTGQPADSPGFSTTGILGGRVNSRRINLRVGNPKLLNAVLPHEVTHVVLADLFGETPIPRWADEGMAALSEPESEQALRAGDLADQIHSATLFEARDLLVMDYPDENQWPLYYAQSISLTRYLVERKGAPAFLAFLRDAQRNGYDVELARVYGLSGYADLQRRWTAQVSAALTGADRHAVANPETKAAR